MIDNLLGNLTILAVLIIVIWLAALVYYYRTSRQQREIQEELDALRAQLEETEQEER